MDFIYKELKNNINIKQHEISSFFYFIKKTEYKTDSIIYDIEESDRNIELLNTSDYINIDFMKNILIQYNQESITKYMH